MQYLLVLNKKTLGTVEMLKLKRIGAILAASTILVSSSVLAAEETNVLAKIKGEVLVNQGESYVAAQEGMQLNPGDQLMVMDGGMASIEFADGCLYKVNGNEVLRVSIQSACAVNASKAVGPYYTQLSTTPKGNGDKILFGITGLATAAGWAASNNNKKTISP